MSARLRYVETIGVGEAVLVSFIGPNGATARTGRVVPVVDAPGFAAPGDFLAVELDPTPYSRSCIVQAHRHALMPLPAEFKRWGLRFLPGCWRA